MSLVRAALISIGMLGCLSSVASDTPVAGRLAGRDVEVSDATVATQAQASRSASHLPPNGYSGIELLHSTEKDLFARFSGAQRSKLLFGAGEVYEGYCYRSPDGTYAAFNLAAFSQFDAAQLSSSALGSDCRSTSVRLDQCIGPYCLGQTREQVERQLGVELGGIVTDDGLEVAYFDYSAPMSPAERKKFGRFNLADVPVKHNLWFRFKDERLDYVGVGRWEDLP